MASFCLQFNCSTTERYLLVSRTAVALLLSQSCCVPEDRPTHGYLVRVDATSVPTPPRNMLQTCEKVVHAFEVMTSMTIYPPTKNEVLHVLYDTIQQCVHIITFNKSEWG